MSLVFITKEVEFIADATVDGIDNRLIAATRFVIFWFIEAPITK